MKPLERELETALLDLYEKWKAFGPPKNRFLQMLRRKGAVGTVKHLLSGNILSSPVSVGFQSLVLANALELTVEWLVLYPKWLPLFTDEELDNARARIRVALPD